MRIHELADYIYEDLEPRITFVRWVNESLEIGITCEDAKEDRMRHFRIVCAGVVEAHITPTVFGCMSMPLDHPVLLNHTDDFGYLTFSSSPQTAEVVVSRLYETHYRVCADWRPLSEYVNHLRKEGLVALLNGGMGMIAQGPYKILLAYQEAIGGLLETSLVRTERKSRDSVSILLLDSEFVIAQSFESHEETA